MNSIQFEDQKKKEHHSKNLEKTMGSKKSYFETKFFQILSLKDLLTRIKNPKNEINEKNRKDNFRAVKGEKKINIICWNE